MSMTMEALCFWAIGPVLAMAYRRDDVTGIMESLSPWHRVLGGIIVVVFYSTHLVALIPRQ
jgi:hypothetical protein